MKIAFLFGQVENTIIILHNTYRSTKEQVSTPVWCWGLNAVLVWAGWLVPSGQETYAAPRHVAVAVAFKALRLLRACPTWFRCRKQTFSLLESAADVRVVLGCVLWFCRADDGGDAKLHCGPVGVGYVGYWAPVSRVPRPVPRASCLVSRVSCLVPRASRPAPRASCPVPRASCLAPPAPPASCLA
jgi:hypothetical protein